MTLVVYGIKNCNSMKKAFALLDEHDKAYRFHDFKKEGLPLNTLAPICELAALETLINTKGTTYKKLKDQGINTITQEVVSEHPTLLKRPLLVCYENEKPQKVLVGLSGLESLL